LRQQVELVAWLAQYMESHDMDIDLRDHCGHTPLHLAARAGHASAVAILVAHGADVTAKVRSKVIRFLSVAPPPPSASSQPQTGVLSHQNPSTATCAFGGSYMELSNRTATGCGRPIGQGHRRPKDGGDDFAQFFDNQKN
jgi:Ankyrin repeats (many copies)